MSLCDSEHSAQHAEKWYLNSKGGVSGAKIELF